MTKPLMSAWNMLRTAAEDLRHRPGANVASLDVLRSLAILLVFSNHTDRAFATVDWIGNLPFVNWGWTGVDLFFVLSGYLIGSQLWKELRKSGRIQVGRFILRRGFRIWPLY